MKLSAFDGFILFYDRDRKAAANTMTFVFLRFATRFLFRFFDNRYRFLEKHISSTLVENFQTKSTEHVSTNMKYPPIYSLAYVKDLSSLSVIKPYPSSNNSVLRQSGSIRNFIECNSTEKRKRKEPTSCHWFSLALFSSSVAFLKSMCHDQNIASYRISTLSK